MKAIVVVVLELASPDDLLEAVDEIDAPSIPHFAGELLIAVEPAASRVTEWLQEGVVNAPIEKRDQS